MTLLSPYRLGKEMIIKSSRLEHCSLCVFVSHITAKTRSSEGHAFVGEQQKNKTTQISKYFYS